MSNSNLCIVSLSYIQPTTDSPSYVPTEPWPTYVPTESPSYVPTGPWPTYVPTESPSYVPTTDTPTYVPTEYTSEEPTETLLTVSKFKEMVDAWEPTDNSGRALRGEANMEWLETMKVSGAEENASERLRNKPADQVGRINQRGSGRSTNPLKITSEYGIEMVSHRLLGKGGKGLGKGGKGKGE